MLAPALAGIPERVGFIGEWRYGLLTDIRHGEKDLPRMIDQCAVLALPWLTWWRSLGALLYEESSDCKISQLVISGESGKPTPEDVQEAEQLLRRQPKKDKAR